MVLQAEGAKRDLILIKIIEYQTSIQQCRRVLGSCLKD